jgi:hypothetical protein
MSSSTPRGREEAAPENMQGKGTSSSSWSMKEIPLLFDHAMLSLLLSRFIRWSGDCVGYHHLPTCSHLQGTPVSGHCSGVAANRRHCFFLCGWVSALLACAACLLPHARGGGKEGASTLPRWVHAARLCSLVPGHPRARGE